MSAADQSVRADLLRPFWRSETAFREPLFFLRDQTGQPGAAAVLFQPTGVLELTSATGETVFTEGVDYRVDPSSRQLVLTRDSRIPCTDREALYYGRGHMQNGGAEKAEGRDVEHEQPSDGETAQDNHGEHAQHSDAKKAQDGHGENAQDSDPVPDHAIDHLRGDPSVKLLFGEGRFFHDLQCCVTYTHAERWDGILPAAHGGALPRTAGLLAAGDSLRLCLSGDSISAGGNASGCTGAPPHMPAYGELVTRGLQQRYGVSVAFTNLAVGGQGAAHGMEVAEEAAAARPDLMIIAYGMNDVGRGDPDAFRAQIDAGMKTIRRSSELTEFVLVAPMLGNPEWAHTPTEAFGPYRDALASLCGEGVALADMTQIWKDLLRRKSYHDLTGNGVNHPNDFGHRVYAQVLLRLLSG
jgi:acyl-CoA thioesterase I